MDRLKSTLVEASVAGAAGVRWSRIVRIRDVCNEMAMAEDTAIEVVLQRSGLTFMVPPDKSILQVLIEEGIDPLYDCQRGECGICRVAVLEGEPDHRDHILSDEERAGNKVMQICVSRAKTPRLVIDL
jgi:ferredoxin